MNAKGLQGIGAFERRYELMKRRTNARACEHVWSTADVEKPQEDTETQ